MIIADGMDHYAYILVYVDDILIIDKNPEQFMIKDTYTVKPSSIRKPKVYLGANIRKVFNSDNAYAWSMESCSYVKDAICNFKKQLYQIIIQYKLIRSKLFAKSTLLHSRL